MIYLLLGVPEERGKLGICLPYLGASLARTVANRTEHEILISECIKHKNKFGRDNPI